MNKKWLSSTNKGFRISVQITPNAKKTEILDILDDTIRIRLQAQPVDGKANDALVRFVAKELGIPRNQVEITHGFTNKRKLLEIQTQKLSLEEIEKIFSASKNS